jgi:hypothetical protein
LSSHNDLLGSQHSLQQPLRGPFRQPTQGHHLRPLDLPVLADVAQQHLLVTAAVYSVVSDKAAYTRQVGFGPIQHEQMLLSFIRQHGQIKRAEVMALCHLTEGQVKRLLQRMLAAKQIVMRGQGKTTTYVEPE